MVLSTSMILSVFPVTSSSLPTSTVVKLETFSLKIGGVVRIRGVTAPSVAPKNRKLATHFSVSASSDGNASVETDVPFPTDYSELLEQARIAAELAMKDNKKLMEIEFPTAGLASVPGDGEGGIEMTGSMQLIREFCDRFITSEKATRTRILLQSFKSLSSSVEMVVRKFVLYESASSLPVEFDAQPCKYQFFPEASEVDFARQSAFSGASFKLDYLTKPSFFQDFGFVEKVKMSDRVKAGDELFLVAYPYFNVNEMLVVEELYKEAVLNTERKLIIFNGELDRIRSGYYPPFFYPKLAALTKSFLPVMETVYYIHNFKGRNGGTLFRCYPGPWKVLRRMGSSKYVCLHQQDTMPSLKEVALEILPTT